MNKELTPEQIKEQKVYLEWGLTQKEYEYICDKLYRNWSFLCNVVRTLLI